jgi:hypothetical protein
MRASVLAVGALWLPALCGRMGVLNGRAHALLPLSRWQEDDGDWLRKRSALTKQALDTLPQVHRIMQAVCVFVEGKGKGWQKAGVLQH